MFRLDFFHKSLNWQISLSRTKLKKLVANDFLHWKLHGPDMVKKPLEVVFLHTQIRFFPCCRLDSQYQGLTRKFHVSRKLCKKISRGFTFFGVLIIGWSQEIHKAMLEMILFTIGKPISYFFDQSVNLHLCRRKTSQYHCASSWRWKKRHVK